MATTKKVTRITASDKTPKKVKAEKPAAPATRKNVFARIGGYFKGAWVELRQVRWPNRRATWALTIAVVVFSLFFVALILLLDMFFKWVFELIIT